MTKAEDRACSRLHSEREWKRRFLLGILVVPWAASLSLNLEMTEANLTAASSPGALLIFLFFRSIFQLNDPYHLIFEC